MGPRVLDVFAFLRVSPVLGDLELAEISEKLYERHSAHGRHQGSVARYQTVRKQHVNGIAYDLIDGLVA